MGKETTRDQGREGETHCEGLWGVYTSLRTLIGIKVHMSNTLPGTRGNEFGERSWGKGSTPFQSMSRLQSNEIIHVLKLEDFVAPTHPTWL